ncbi:MAG: RDD family protein [Oscillospiraceae bacterium]|nr:RDD family protein [Oscillospiraceae bacterium]
MRDNGLRAAPFFPRAAAFILDKLIVGLVLLGPRIAMLARGMGGDALSTAVLFTFSWTDIVLWLLGTAYFAVLTALTGATPGKKAMGLTVVDENGEKPDVLTVLCRETFGRYLSSILCIGYILCAVDPERGALHDRICDTRVVYAPAKAAAAPRYAAVHVPPVDTAALPAADGDWYAPNR